MKILDIPLGALLAADVEILDLRQGSEEWARFRRTRYGASEAAAMLGLSKIETRSDLLRRYHTGLQVEHSDFVQERVLDRGHAVEAAIRPHIEEAIGDDLSPVTCARRGTKIAASLDGLTLMRETAWECKQWNAELAEQVRASTVPDTHMPQCQQELLVTGARRLIFTVSDGTTDRTVSCEVLPDLHWFDRILRGWQQFEADLISYAPEPEAADVVASPVEALPAVSVRMDGAIVSRDNLPAFGDALRAFIARIPQVPSTDQEFADTDAACKALKRAEEALDAAEVGALASIASVDDLRRTIATLRDLARQTRLAREKVVASRKDQLRADAISAGAQALADHIERMRPQHAGHLTFARSAAVQELGAEIRGLKSLDSIRAKIDAKVAALKTAATAAAERIAVNRATIIEAGADAQAIFADVDSLVTKDPEAVRAIVAQRLAERRAAEERRLEAERERIRREEAARLEREAAAATLAATPAAQALPDPRPPLPPTAVAPAAPSASAKAEPLKLSALCARLGWTLKAAEVEALGVRTTRQGAMTLIEATDLPRLKAAMVSRVEAL